MSLGHRWCLRFYHSKSRSQRHEDRDLCSGRISFIFVLYTAILELHVIISIPHSLGSFLRPMILLEAGASPWTYSNAIRKGNSDVKHCLLRQLFFCGRLGAAAALLNLGQCSLGAVC